MALAETLFTQTLAGPTSLVLIEDMGIERFSVKCTSVTAVTLTGTKTLAGLTSNAVTITENQIFSMQVQSGIVALTLTVPAGATAEVTAM